VKFTVNISTASLSTASVFHKHININTGNALLVTAQNATELGSRLYLITFFTIWSKMKQIQQNSSNPMPNNSEIPVICHLKRVVPRPRLLLLPEKKKNPHQ